MSECWRDIPGLPGYQVSDLGRVRSVDRVVKTARGSRTYRGTLLKPGVGSHGYLTFAAGKGNSFCVHVAVALAWIGPAPSEKHEVRHKDDVRFHNWKDNIEWGTRSDNNRDKKWNLGQKTYVLKPEEVAAIKVALRAPYHGQGRELADKFGVSESVISAIKHGRTHSDV